MYGIVRPVAESALSGQSRRPVATNAPDTTYSTGPAHSTNAPDTTHSTGPARSTDSPDTTHSAGPADSTNSSDAPDTTGPADSTNSTGPAHSTDSADTTDSTGPAHTTNAGDAVAIEAIKVVDVNIATAPAATPSVTAAPPRSHQHSRAEGKRSAGCVVARRIVERRIWIRRFTVYSCGLIRRNVHNFRISWLDHNHALVVNLLRFHSLLLRSVQSALVLRLLAHALNGIHHVALVRKEGVAEIGSPLNVVSQYFHDVR